MTQNYMGKEEYELLLQQSDDASVVLKEFEWVAEL